MVSPSSTNAAVTKVGDMIFRVCFVDAFQGYVCAKFARENLKATKAALLYDQTQAYAVGLQEDFAKAFEKLGGKIVEKQTYQGGDDHLRSDADRPGVTFALHNHPPRGGQVVGVDRL